MSLIQRINLIRVPQRHLSGAALVIGTSFAAIGGVLAARRVIVTFSRMRETAKLTGASPFTYYYPGGFEEPAMSRREASLILNVREHASAEDVKAAHRRVMIANHPDRGGSPYVALKINEAAALLKRSQ
jgi:hypothetical protein